MRSAQRERELRQAVRLFVAACGTRRAVAASLRAGSPSGESIPVPHDARYDDALRADLLERALSCIDETDPIVWLTRQGSLEPQDIDRAWCAAAGTAALRIGRRIPFYVVTRHGWLEPRTGETRSWDRIRLRNGPPAHASQV